MASAKQELRVGKISDIFESDFSVRYQSCGCGVRTLNRAKCEAPVRLPYDVAQFERLRVRKEDPVIVFLEEMTGTAPRPTRVVDGYSGEVLYHR